MINFLLKKIMLTHGENMATNRKVILLFVLSVLVIFQVCMAEQAYSNKSDRKFLTISSFLKY